MLIRIGQQIAIENLKQFCKLLPYLNKEQNHCFFALVKPGLQMKFLLKQLWQLLLGLNTEQNHCFCVLALVNPGLQMGDNVSNSSPSSSSSWRRFRVEEKVSNPFVLSWLSSASSKVVKKARGKNQKSLTSFSSSCVNGFPEKKLVFFFFNFPGDIFSFRDIFLSGTLAQKQKELGTNKKILPNQSWYSNWVRFVLSNTCSIGMRYGLPGLQWLELCQPLR